MKRHFSEFYKYSKSEIENIWSNGLFVFDANVLLDLYRFTPNTSKQLIKIMVKLKEAQKLWLPHQIGFEFHRNKEVVTRTVNEEYDRLITFFGEDLFNQIKKTFTEKCNSHPYIDSDYYIDTVHKTFKKISNKLTSSKSHHLNLKKDDQIINKVTNIYSGLVGEQYNKDKIKEIFRLGSERYSNKIPPGFEDAKKDTSARQYGDLIIWLQMIDKAIESKRPIVYITRDKKPDWWDISKEGVRIGPRKELVREMRDEGKNKFLMYEINEFIKISSTKLNILLSEDSRIEIENITKNTKQKDPNADTSASIGINLQDYTSGTVASNISDIESGTVSSN